MVDKDNSVNRGASDNKVVLVNKETSVNKVASASKMALAKVDKAVSDKDLVDLENNHVIILLQEQETALMTLCFSHHVTIQLIIVHLITLCSHHVIIQLIIVHLITLCSHHVTIQLAIVHLITME
jgi:hypothetical protein